MGPNCGEHFEHSQYIMSKVVSSSHWVKEKNPVSFMCSIF